MGHIKKHIVYQGLKFTIEWYYLANDKSEAFEFFHNLDNASQDSIFHLFIVMADMGEIKNITKFRNEEDGVYAFKSKANRFLSFFFTGKKIIITHAFIKKQDKLPPNEKKKALKYKFDYETRVKQGAYYD